MIAKNQLNEFIEWLIKNNYYTKEELNDFDLSRIIGAFIKELKYSMKNQYQIVVSKFITFKHNKYKQYE